MNQEPAATPTPGRPSLPLLDLTVVEAFDLHPGLRRVVFTCADGLPGPVRFWGMRWPAAG